MRAKTSVGAHWLRACIGVLVLVPAIVRVGKQQVHWRGVLNECLRLASLLVLVKAVQN